MKAASLLLTTSSRCPQHREGGRGGGVLSKILPNPPDHTRLSSNIVNPSLKGHRVATVASYAPVLMGTCCTCHRGQLEGGRLPRPRLTDLVKM